MQERSREAVNRALLTIDSRIGASDKFSNHYKTIADNARNLLQQRLEEAG